MDPLGLNRIEPGAFAGQTTDNQPTATLFFNPAVIGFNPVSNFVADVPGGVIPNQKQRPFALVGEGSQHPGQKGGGDGTDRPTRHKADHHLVQSRQIQSITGDGFALRISPSYLLLDQPQRLLLTPAMQGRLSFAAPPDFIFEAQDNVRVVVC